MILKSRPNNSFISERIANPSSKPWCKATNSASPLLSATVAWVLLHVPSVLPPTFNTMPLVLRLVLIQAAQSESQNTSITSHALDSFLNPVP